MSKFDIISIIAGYVALQITLVLLVDIFVGISRWFSIIETKKVRSLNWVGAIIVHIFKVIVLPVPFLIYYTFVITHVRKSIKEKKATDVINETIRRSVCSLGYEVNEDYSFTFHDGSGCIYISKDGHDFCVFYNKDGETKCI